MSSLFLLLQCYYDSRYRRRQIKRAVLSNSSQKTLYDNPRKKLPRFRLGAAFAAPAAIIDPTPPVGDISTRPQDVTSVAWRVDVCQARGVARHDLKRRSNAQTFQF